MTTHTDLPMLLVGLAMTVLPVLALALAARPTPAAVPRRGPRAE